MNTKESNSSSVSVADAGLANKLEWAEKVIGHAVWTDEEEEGWNLNKTDFNLGLKAIAEVRAALESSTQTQEGVRREIEAMFKARWRAYDQSRTGVSIKTDPEWKNRLDYIEGQMNGLNTGFEIVKALLDKKATERKVG
jgi:hypothetical protein